MDQDVYKYVTKKTFIFSMFFIKDAGADENYQIGSPELPNYRELSDNSPFSLGSEDKVLNNGK